MKRGQANSGKKSSNVAKGKNKKTGRTTFGISKSDSKKKQTGFTPDF